MSRLFEQEAHRRMIAGESDTYHSPQAVAYREEQDRLFPLTDKWWEEQGIRLANTEKRFLVMFAQYVLDVERKRLAQLSAGF